MALAFYDADQVAFGANSMRSFHDGNLGGAHEQKIYVRNGDALKYYSSVVIKYTGSVATSNGWSVKFIKGERQPTEAEWDQVASGADLALDDIGNSSAADTSTYFPVWVRFYCPGGTSAAINVAQSLTVEAYERVV